MKTLLKPFHFDYIDAVRGYAVLGVIVVHVASALPPATGNSMRLFESGARGVQLFYMVSAATLLMSWRARGDGFQAFLIRRLFRVAPLIWLATPAYLALAGSGQGYFAPSGDWTSLEVLRQVLFIDSLSPSRGSIVPGGWTINTEILFYLVFPVIVMVVRSFGAALAAYSLSLGCVIICAQSYHESLVSRFSDTPQMMVNVWTALSLPIQLPVFMAGFATFFALDKTWLSTDRDGRVLKIMLVTAIALMIWFSISPPNTYGWWGMPFGVAIFCLGRHAGGLLVNKPIIYLGKVSFSAYVWHFMVMNFVYLGRDHGLDVFAIKLGPNALNFLLFLAFVMLVTLVISAASFHFFERPMIRVGAVLAERVSSRHRRKLDQ
jgi:peptidoglycan/LPS O-acetylase OafA/YrhL